MPSLQPPPHRNKTSATRHTQRRRPFSTTSRVFAHDPPRNCENEQHGASTLHGGRFQSGHTVLGSLHAAMAAVRGTLKYRCDGPNALCLLQGVCLGDSHVHVELGWVAGVGCHHQPLQHPVDTLIDHVATTEADGSLVGGRWPASNRTAAVFGHQLEVHRNTVLWW